MHKYCLLKDRVYLGSIPATERELGQVRESLVFRKSGVCLLFLCQNEGYQIFSDPQTGIPTEETNTITQKHFLPGKTGTDLWMLTPSGYFRGRRKYVACSQG